MRSFLGELYGPDLHAKRIDSLAGATLGVMAAASLAAAMIGQALAQARGLVTRHAVKQVDRLPSNNGTDVWDSFARWMPHHPNGRAQALVAMDGTDFDQSTLLLSLVTGHGRAAPLLWFPIWKAELAARRSDFEDACLRRLAELAPPGWTIRRAFRDTKDLRFGMGLSSTSIGAPTRHDRLLLVSAFAVALLTLLGAVGESLGMDRLLKSTASKTRTHSLSRQGRKLYGLIPTCRNTDWPR